MTSDIRDDVVTPEMQEAAYHLQNNGVIAFPTETVMGLGVVYDDKIAYDRLNNIKERPESKPYTMMLSDVDQIGLFAEVNETAQTIINAFLPGPLTILLPVKKEVVPSWVTHGENVIGIRVPADNRIHDLLAFVGKPILAPSANISGQKPAIDSEQVRQIFGDKIDYILEGKAGGGVSSTVLDVTGNKAKIVREGPISKEMIDKILSQNHKKMKIAVGSDHGGFASKEAVKQYLLDQGYEVLDQGTESTESTDYPIFAEKVGKLVGKGQVDFGVLICTSGEGIAIAANKIKGVRCGIGYNDEVTKLLRQHNNANCIAFGSKFMENQDIIKRINIFLSTPFDGGRHERRVNEITDLEK